MRMGWIMGWAVPESWFAAHVRAIFPEDEHVFFEPADGVLTAVENRGPFDRLVGYSLGAHLLLAEAERVERLGARVILLAPILAFPSEEGLGGRIARTQVRYLSRWVRRDRAGALDDFYARAGLDVRSEEANVIALETLLAGLERLAAGRVDAPAPAGWRMYAGAEDSLLDAGSLARQLPALVTVAGATHHPAALLRAWKEAGR